MSEKSEDVGSDYRPGGTVAGQRPAHRTTWNPEDGESLSMTIVDAIAEAKGVAPVDIDQPLYDVVDPDALDALFTARDGTAAAGHVVFTAAGYEVTATATGVVEVRPIE